MPDGPASMQEAAELLESSLSDFESNLPLYKSRVDARNEVLVMYGTMQEFYNIVNSEEYENIVDESVYDEVLAKIDAIVDMKITVKSIDGKKSEDFPADEAVVRFCEYMYTYTAGHHEESYEYMKMVEELKPEYLWLYAYEMGVVEAQTGNLKDAEKLADKLYNMNKETSGAYCLYSSIERLKGNYDKAVEWADEGIENCPADTELLRNKAMALVCDGDAKTAKKVIDEAKGYEENGLLYMVSVVIENELGNKDEVKELVTYIEENGVSVTDKVNDYLKGKITVEELFAEGSGDIE
jgi:tetratricopeptide (TPR) repeat protein